MTKDPQQTDNPITVLLPLCAPQLGLLICNNSSSSSMTIPAKHRVHTSNEKVMGRTHPYLTPTGTKRSKKTTVIPYNSKGTVIWI